MQKPFYRCQHAQFAKLLNALEQTEAGPCINIDFSVVNDMNYYDGIIFKGFINRIPDSILSGGRYDRLMEAIERFGLNAEDYWWYTDLRKYGGTKHAGYGLGFERLIMYITGVQNIRDVESFPRTTGNADF